MSADHHPPWLAERLTDPADNRTERVEKGVDITLDETENPYTDGSQVEKGSTVATGTERSMDADALPDLGFSGEGAATGGASGGVQKRGTREKSLSADALPDLGIAGGTDPGGGVEKGTDADADVTDTDADAEVTDADVNADGGADGDADAAALIKSMEGTIRDILDLLAGDADPDDTSWKDIEQRIRQLTEEAETVDPTPAQASAIETRADRLAALTEWVA